MALNPHPAAYSNKKTQSLYRNDAERHVWQRAYFRSSAELRHLSRDAKHEAAKQVAQAAVEATRNQS